MVAMALLGWVVGIIILCIELVLGVTGDGNVIVDLIAGMVVLICITYLLFVDWGVTHDTNK